MTGINVIQLAGVVYSSGKVFDGLQTGRLSTAEFLRSGDTTGIASRPDLELLLDLRDVAQLIVDRDSGSVDVDLVKLINATIRRSGSLEPGAYRRAEQGIGVWTPHGEHQPPAQDDESLQQIIDAALAHDDPHEQAIELFVNIAKAQPFMDGNKRTALFAANVPLLFQRDKPEMLVIPVDEKDPSTVRLFNDFLAQAYVFNEHGGVNDLLRRFGIVPAGMNQPVASSALKSVLVNWVNGNRVQRPKDQLNPWVQIPSSEPSDEADA
ncbi:Fic family protein [Leucobacter luti]|uniref:Fic family protein n=1 Tax=Leucobacter luti TaxID=340320 RepID=UPI003D076D15